MAIGKNRKSVAQAAKAIGVTKGRIRQMITSGECRAIKVETHLLTTGYYWEIPDREVERLKNLPQVGGRPRSGTPES